jgi:flavin reductase (DIM6/NTAB) family NADH-FMN oxidoreductase RutF
MAKQKWKGGALLAPVPPAMVTCGNDADGTSNIITVAWTGIINTIPPKTYVSIRPSRHSYALIRESGEFAINLTSTDLVRAADFCGIYTGAKVNKFEKCSLHKEVASEVSCPLIEESPLSLECRVTDVIELGSHHMFLADIVAVDVDEKLLNADGKLCLDKGKLAAFAHGEYFALGEKLGYFGFSVKKKKKKPNPKNVKRS